MAAYEGANCIIDPLSPGCSRASLAPAKEGLEHLIHTSIFWWCTRLFQACSWWRKVSFHGSNPAGRAPSILTPR